MTMQQGEKNATKPRWKADNMLTVARVAVLQSRDLERPPPRGRQCSPTDTEYAHYS